jgi:hypothetical protein
LRIEAVIAPRLLIVPSLDCTTCVESERERNRVRTPERRPREEGAYHVVLEVEDNSHASNNQQDHSCDHSARVALAFGALSGGEVENLLAIDVRDGLLAHKVESLLGNLLELRHPYGIDREAGALRGETERKKQRRGEAPHSMALVASVRFQYSSISCAQKATKVQKAGTVYALPRAEVREP